MLLSIVGALAASVFIVIAIDLPRVAVLAATVALIVCALALALHHRRKLAELREMHVDQGFGQFRPINYGLRWPKRCTYCHQRVHSWKEAGAHQDPKVSSCAVLIERNEAELAATERAQAEAVPWTATVIPRGGGAGAVDTLEDEDEGR